VLGAKPLSSKEVQFSVADGGPGIESDQLPHVFDRFWRADETSRAGLGLGLPEVTAAIEARWKTLNQNQGEDG